MPRYLIRSTIYNLCFFGLTACACILCLPTLLMPRRVFMGVVHAFVFCNHILERYILGLDFEVRGREHLPATGSYIIAAKHQSAHETTKLHILFDDPAIILKQELLKIPLWGRYLAKSDVIAIDRSTPKSAIESIQMGARRMKEQGRPIIIFPQGTRVAPETDVKQRPYKIGVIRLQEATGLPIIPLAMNTGVFWPRNSWIKKPGCAVFEFLEPILPGESAEKTLATLQERLEQRSIQLMYKATDQIANDDKPRWKMPAIICVLLLSLAYTINWMVVAHFVKTEINRALDDLEIQGAARILKRPDLQITGFPGKMFLTLGETEILSPAGSAQITALTASAWPLPRMPITVQITQTEVKERYWTVPLIFEQIQATIRPRGRTYDLLGSEANSDTFIVRANGMMDLENEDDPQIVMNIELQNHQPFIQKLVENRIVHPQSATMIGGALGAMQKNGIAQITLTSRGNAVYFGPFKIFQFRKRQIDSQQK